MALIYVVEDDDDIREIETVCLRNSGHDVVDLAGGAALFERLEQTQPDLLLLDIMLPDMDGNTVVKKLRGRPETKRLPVIMVTAKTTELDMIRGLENGADDYIKKPFSVMELIARVKALLRRCEDERDDIIVLAEIEMDNGRRRCTVNGQALELTFKEYELLRYLMLNKGMVMSREQILYAVWDTSFAGGSRTVDMHIKTLRQKLGSAGEHIRTVRNVGYAVE